MFKILDRLVPTGKLNDRKVIDQSAKPAMPEHIRLRLENLKIHKVRRLRIFSKEHTNKSYTLMKPEKCNYETVYFRSQILERPSIGEYWNISGVPVLPENVISTLLRTC